MILSYIKQNILSPLDVYISHIKYSQETNTPMFTKILKHFTLSGETCTLKDAIKGLYPFALYELIIPSVLVIFMLIHIYKGIHTVALDYVQKNTLLKCMYYVTGWLVIFSIYTILVYIIHRAGLIHSTDYFFRGDSLIQKMVSVHQNKSVESVSFLKKFFLIWNSSSNYWSDYIDLQHSSDFIPSLSIYIDIYNISETIK